jgi:putative membrane protein
MKNKLTTIAIVALGSFYLASSAVAQNPRSYPALKTGANRPLETPAPAKKAEAAPKAGSKLSAADKAFMMDAAKGGMMEVTWGQWASQKAQNADVKKFGSQMVADHSKWNNELMALAKEEGVSLPANKASGKWKSDKDYMDMMVKDHEKDLAAFQAQAQKGADPDLKKWAGQTAKGVKKHLEMAKKIQGKLK